MNLYPVNLCLSGKKCLVVGGGNVALRKIRSLLGCQAQVTVVSPEVTVGIVELAKSGSLVLHLRAYISDDLADAFLVFAATDNPQVQKSIAADAARRNILLNSADDPKRCDFQVPANVRRGDLLLTISTGGASPALSKVIREQLEQQFGLEYAKVVSLFAKIREVVIDGHTHSAVNRKLFHMLLEEGIVEHAHKADWHRVIEILSQHLPGTVNTQQLVESLSTDCNCMIRRGSESPDSAGY